jgi:hypothetical protein
MLIQTQLAQRWLHMALHPNAVVYRVRRFVASSWPALASTIYISAFLKYYTVLLLALNLVLACAYGSKRWIMAQQYLHQHHPSMHA